jgi:hypothetical protein
MLAQVNSELPVPAGHAARTLKNIRKKLIQFFYHHRIPRLASQAWLEKEISDSSPSKTNIFLRRITKIISLSY